MRLPNGYGSVVNLGKGRRKPYAVRISNGRKENESEKVIPKYKYLGYFEKSKDAYGFLAKYNAGEPVKEHVPYIEQPTFSDIYKKWYEYRHAMNKKPSQASSRSYEYAFKLCAALHDKKMKNIKTEELQEVVDKYKGQSRSVVGNIKTLLFAMYRYCLKYDYIERDYSKLVDFEWSDEKRIEHVNFKIDEINRLWQNLEIPFVDYILIMIYTGWRASELCNLKTKDIHIKERYMIGGMKTDAGKRRIVPIHKKILPLVEKIYNKDNEYFASNSLNEPLIYKTLLYNFKEAMSTLDMSHIPHDTRYTTATLLDNAGANKVCIKKIMGHTIQDITDGVYIQKDLCDLLTAIDLIDV